MYTTLRYLCVGLSMLMMFSCQKEDGSVSLSNEDSPKIFIKWANVLEVQSGGALTISPLVSPSNEATFVWKLDDVVISENKDLNYNVSQPVGSYKLVFQVDRFGKTTSRTATVNIK